MYCLPSSVIGSLMVNTCSMILVVDCNFSSYSLHVVFSLQNTERAIKLLDHIYPYETHKIGVIYVGPRQVSIFDRGQAP